MKRIALPLCLVGAILLAYVNSFSGAFVFDESQSVIHSSKIRFEQTTWGDWLGPRAVGDLSFALNFRFGGRNPWGYHVVNLAIHILSALLAYGLIRRVAARGSGGINPEYLAFWVALFWGIHPLTTSAVTYVCQRYESLMGLFYLLTLYSVLRGNGSARHRAWYALAVAACFLGMGTKEIMITAPVVVLVFDRIFLAKSFRDILKRRGWLYAGMAFSWGFLAWLMNVRMSQDGAFDQIYGQLSFTYLLTQCRVIVHYLRLAIWPSALCLDYGWPVSDGLAGDWPFLLLAGTLGVITLLGLWRAPRISFFGVFFFTVLAPTSSLVARPDPACEHRMYLSLLAVVALLILGAMRLTLALAADPKNRGACRYVCMALLATAVLSYGGATWMRNRDYRSRRIMWQDVVEKAPLNLRGYVNLAAACLDEGDVPAAEDAARGLLAQAPEQAMITEGGHAGAARDVYRSFDRLYCAQAENILGIVALERGELDTAEEHLRAATRLWRDFLDPYVNLGIVFDRQGDSDKAIEWWNDTLSLVPTHEGALLNLSAYYRRQGLYDNALVYLKRLAAARPEREEIQERIRQVTALAEAEKKDGPTRR